MNQKVIYTKNIKHNLSYYKSFGKKLIIMVKANAYGHGVETIAKILAKEEVVLGVATIKEAVSLRKYWKKDILIVEPVSTFEQVADGGFLFAIDSLSSFYEVISRNLTQNCYVKINTGMNRFGIRYDSKELKKIASLSKKHGLRGLMTHFSFVQDRQWTLLQQNRFQKARKRFGERALCCFGGSGAIESSFSQLEKESRLYCSTMAYDGCDEIRVGIGFYGYENEVLLPIMTIKSQVLKIVCLKKGESLGYNNAFVAPKDMIVAIVGVGYGDGLRRDLKGFYVKVAGIRAEIVGNICMDCLFIDVSKGFCHEGDEVEIEDAHKSAKYLGTISYEVLTGYSLLRGETIVY